jgi:hypothetical protein
MPSEIPSQAEHPADEPILASLVDEADSFGSLVTDGRILARPSAAAGPIHGKDLWNRLTRFRPPPRADYVVPRRFGMSAILGIMTALSLVYGGLFWADAWPVFYGFTAVQVLIVCLVQMCYGNTPRAASAVAGALTAPLFMMLAAVLSADPIPAAAVVCLMLALVPFGAFLGYLTGTCAAGVFLVMDKLEPYLKSGLGPNDNR